MKSEVTIVRELSTCTCGQPSILVRVEVEDAERMSPEALVFARELRRYSIQNGGFRFCNVKVRQSDFDRVAIQAELKVLHRDTGEPTVVKSSVTVGLIEVKVARDFEGLVARVFRTLLRDMVLHELDEMIRIDGYLLADPHRP